MRETSKEVFKVTAFNPSIWVGEEIVKEREEKNPDWKSHGLNVVDVHFSFP